MTDALLDDMVRLYASAAPVFLSRLSPVILTLHAALFTLQFAWDLIRWNLSDGNMFTQVVRKLLVFLISYGLIILLPLWLPPLLRGWEELGQLVSGMPGLGPSTIFRQGWAVAFDVFNSLEDFGILIIPGMGGLRLVLFVTTLIAWIVIAFHLAKLLVESAIALGGLPIMLAFAGHSVTFGMAEGFFRYLISLGVRIYVTYLLVGVGRHLANEWTGSLGVTGAWNIFTESITLASGAAFFALLVVTLPRSVAQHVAGGVSFAGMNPLGHREA